MSNLSVLGSYSGIDMTYIDGLIEAERSKGVRFTKRKEQVENQQKAWKNINSQLDSLFKSLEKLSQKETFETRTVTSNVKDSSFLSVKAETNADVGQYRIQVQQLATATRLTGAKLEFTDVESIHDDLGISGGFSFTVDGTDFYEIEIETTDSLKDITNKINSLTEDSSIKASIVDNRLVLTHAEMGDNNIQVSGDLAEQLGFGEGASNLVAGQSAIFTVDGIEITRETNIIDDVVDGLTFELKNVHTDNHSEVITIAYDHKKTTDAVREFVEQYNSVMKFISTQMDVGDPTAENNVTGALTGDSAIMRLQSGLRSLVTKNIEGNFSGKFKNIEDLGITIDRDGIATLDEDVFNQALQEDPASVARFFYHEEVVSEIVIEDGEEVTKKKLEKHGMSELLKNFIDTYISSNTGIISTKNDTYDRLIKDINNQINTFNERIDRKRERYIRQFTAVDIAMMQAESQLDYLYSQVNQFQN